jgi:cell division protein FtsB
MDIGRMVRRKLKAGLAPAVFLALTGYFAWNTSRGEHGLRNHAVREEQLRAALAERDAARAEQERWEKRVAGLRTTHLDGDSLDERARAMLNLADPNDIVVPYGPGRKLF